MSSAATNPVVSLLQLDQIYRDLTDLTRLSWMAGPGSYLSCFKFAVELLTATTAGAVLTVNERHQLGFRPEAVDAFQRVSGPTVTNELVTRLRAFPEDYVRQMLDVIEARLRADGCSAGVVGQLLEKVVWQVFPRAQPSPSPSSEDPDRSSSPPAVADGAT